MAGLPFSIASYEISRGKRTHQDNPTSSTKLCIRVKNNINQIPELERVEMTECWTEEEKIPIKTAPKVVVPPKAAEEGKEPAAAGEEEKAAPVETPAPVEPAKTEYETKIRKKERTTEVPFKTISHAIPPDMKV